MSKLVFTFVFGTVLGAGGAFALTPQTRAVTLAPQSGAWTHLHAAITAQDTTEDAPTF